MTKTDDERRTKVVQIRLSNSEKEAIKKEADELHLSMASYIRSKLLASSK